MQSPAAGPDGTWIDLKDFYAKCFGQLTDEFLGLDPKGVLAPGEAATEVVEYTSCGDGKLTFVSGWKEPVAAGELRLLVTAPSGDLVLASEPGVESSTQPTWDFDRVHLPYRGSSSGTWKAQLVRAHSTFVNGFASDAFPDFEAGVALVRREVQRLCPEGCPRALLFEDDVRGDSVYRKAAAIEEAADLLGRVETARDAADFARLLERGRWDLVVYAHQGPAVPEPYDDLLARRLCDGQRAIVTDTRGELAAAILRCAGAVADGSTNHRRLAPEATLAAGPLELADADHPVFSYGLKPLGTGIEARFEQGQIGVVARFERGQEQRWFLDVLVRGLARLEPHRPKSKVVTGDDLLPTVRISPMTVPAGGYDRVDARVEIERPLIGLGTLIARAGLRRPTRIGEEMIDGRAATLMALGAGGTAVPTATDVYPLFDDGTNGDQVAGNAYWSAQLPGVAAADGMYRYRFILDLEKDGCTTRRELAQSVWVEIGVDPQASGVKVEPGPNGGHVVTLTPRDPLGNLWGPGRPVAPSCGPAGSCKCDAAGVQDLGQGSYSIAIDTAAGARACTLDAFGTRFQVPLAGAGASASCDRLRKAIETADLQSVMRLRLQEIAARTCADLTVARGGLALAEAGAAAGLAEVGHELTSHAQDLSAADRAELERALAEVAAEHGLAGAGAADHQH